MPWRDVKATQLVAELSRACRDCKVQGSLFMRPPPPPPGMPDFGVANPPLYTWVIPELSIQ